MNIPTVQKTKLQIRDSIYRFHFVLLILIALVLQTSLVSQALSPELDPLLMKPYNQSIDVIIIQSEAFMELTKVKELSFSKDPLPHYKEWQKKSMYGQLKVPVNGGLTCNTEFELLTGIRQKAIAPNPYVDLLAQKDQKFNGLPWRLKTYGFTTLGIHPYESDYFNRDIVYPRLGFDTFYSMSSFVNPQKYGHWISDQDCFDMIGHQLDLTPTNQLIFNVTVQNHAPFSYKSSNDLIHITSKVPMSKDDQTSLQNYATGLWYTDLALDEFLKKIEKRQKRTLVVFYGDHQPSKNHKSFANMSFFKENGYYTTDYFIYDNKHLIQKGKKDLALIQMGQTLEKMLGIYEETPLNLYNQIYGYKAYDQLNAEILRGYFEEENQKLESPVPLVPFSKIIF